jgi:hypothetical protein
MNENGQRRRDQATKWLKDRFPLKYVMFHSIGLIVIGVVSIVLQIVLLTDGALNSSLSNGIWGGVVCLGLSILTEILSK